MGNFFGSLFYIVTVTVVQGLLKGLYVLQIELQLNKLQYTLLNNFDLIQHILGRQVDASNGI